MDPRRSRCVLKPRRCRWRRRWAPPHGREPSECRGPPEQRVLILLHLAILRSFEPQRWGCLWNRRSPLPELGGFGRHLSTEPERHCIRLRYSCSVLGFGFGRGASGRRVVQSSHARQHLQQCQQRSSHAGGWRFVALPSKSSREAPPPVEQWVTSGRDSERAEKLHAGSPSVVKCLVLRVILLAGLRGGAHVLCSTRTILL